MAKNNMKEFIRDCDKYVEDVSGQITFNLLGMSGVDKAVNIPNVSVKKSKTKRGVRAEVTHKTHVGKTYRQQQGVVDMKPWFKRSSKVKRTRKGGWYMVVPIRKYTTSSKKAQTAPTKGMRRDVYDAVRQLKPENPNITHYMMTTSHKNLYESMPKITSPIFALNYKRQSKNITKVQKGRQAEYYAFRTVSDKSAPNSWLLHKDTEDPNNPSAEARRIMNELQDRIRENMMKL